ncbi:MAG: DNA-binding beta-propeller fold protein YncE [Lysobacterales bacterium]|jgi:DNA-binding beta-propeller fold protein YncE
MNEKMKPALIIRMIGAIMVLGLSFTAAAEFEYQGQFGGPGTLNGQFDSPRGVAAEAGGMLVIADSSNNRIQVCSYSGTCFDFGDFGDASGEFDRPREVAVNSLNRLFIADRGNDRIQNCAVTGSCTDFGGSGTVSGKFSSPRGVAINSDSRIVVTDTNNNRIQICTNSGNCTTFGSLGSTLGMFNSPAGVAVTSTGELVVADRGNDRIQVCSTTGSCTAFGSFGTAPGQFDTPAGVAVDSLDRIIVADRFNNRIQVCSTTGTCSAFGSFGTGNGQFNQPWGVGVDPQGRIIVADTNNNRIQIFAEALAVSIDSFTASPSTIDAGQSVQLSWAVSNATTCIPKNGTASWRAKSINPSEGSTNILISTAGSYQFTMECTGGGSTVSANIAVTVTEVVPDFMINAGLNDAWVSADTSFQGFFFTVFENLNLFFLSWFTFDSVPPSGDVATFGAADQRWVTASGVYTGNSVTLNLELTSGGIFNGSVPLAVQSLAYGTISIVFNNCNEAVLDYNIPSLGLFGQMTLTRVVTSNVALCELLSAP